MSALMVARIHAKDPGKQEEYLAGSKNLATPHGARLVYQGKVARTLDGEQKHEMPVIAEFPDVQNINDRFDSEEYKPLVPLREQAADMHMTN